MKRLLAASLLVVSGLASANPFEVGTTLSGDPRDTNPRFIDITVSGAVAGNKADIVVDLAPLAGIHDDAKLLSFYFNLQGDSADYSLGNFVPDWEVTRTDIVNPQGGGGSTRSTGFLFESKPSAPAGQNEVNLSQTLSFTIADLVDDFTAADFGDAPTWESNDLILGGGQIGAHIGGLTVSRLTCPAGACSDSGFATGDWTTSVDAPGVIALLSLGLVGLVVHRKYA